MNQIKGRILTDIQTYYRGVLLAAAYLGVMSLLGIPICPLVLFTGLPRLRHDPGGAALP